MAWPTRCCMKAERGFTLLEVMVALTVFAVLAAAVLTASHWVLRQSLQVEERVMAAWVLDNQLQTLRLQPALLHEPGPRNVSLGGRDWQVQQHVARVPGKPLLHVQLRAGVEGAGALGHWLDAWLESAQ